MSAPGWIYPGADIVIWRDDHNHANPTFYETKVATVAKQSFKVENVDDRFRLDTLATSDRGGSWNSWRFRAIEVGSEKHYKLRTAAALRRAELNAHSAVDRWVKERRDVVAISSAIGALTVLHDELARGAQ